jgi:hypothetical protein
MLGIMAIETVVVHTVVQHDVPMPGNISGDHLRILEEGVTLHALHIKSRNFDGCRIMHGNANRARPEARSIYLYRFRYRVIQLKRAEQEHPRQCQ